METLCPLCGGRTPAEPDAEADAPDHTTQALAREQVFEELLGHCVIALEALLASPDLNLDCLEPTTQDAMKVARETLQAVKAEIE